MAAIEYDFDIMLYGRKYLPFNIWARLWISLGTPKSGFTPKFCCKYQQHIICKTTFALSDLIFETHGYVFSAYSNVRDKKSKRFQKKVFSPFIIPRSHYIGVLSRLLGPRCGIDHCLAEERL